MRQQTIHALKEYLEHAHVRYVAATHKADAIRLLEIANNLTPLVEHVGLAKDM